MNDEPAEKIPEIESAMDTGQGADDEPEMTIGDRYDTDPMTPEDAEEALGVPETEPTATNPADHRREP